MLRFAARQPLVYLALAVLFGAGLAMPVQAETAMELAREHNRDWNRLFNNEDADSLAELYAEDALVSPASGEVIEGRDAIRELFQGYVDSGLNKHRLTIVRAAGSGDWFYEVAEWRVSGAPKNAMIPLYKGIVTIIFKRNDSGDWLIHSHTWNQEPDQAT